MSKLSCELPNCWSSSNLEWARFSPGIKALACDSCRETWSGELVSNDQ